MTQQKDFRPIYKHLLKYCQPYSHGGAWQELPVLAGICRPPADSPVVLNELQQKFSQADLQESGVLVMDETLAVGLEPSLCDQTTLIIPLRKTRKGDPFELLTGHGTLSGRRLPVCASLDDGRVQRLAA